MDFILPRRYERRNFRLHHIFRKKNEKRVRERVILGRHQLKVNFRNSTLYLATPSSTIKFRMFDSKTHRSCVDASKVHLRKFTKASSLLHMLVEFPTSDDANEFCDVLHATFGIPIYTSLMETHPINNNRITGKRRKKRIITTHEAHKRRAKAVHSLASDLNKVLKTTP